LEYTFQALKMRLARGRRTLHLRLNQRGSALSVALGLCSKLSPQMSDIATNLTDKTGKLDTPEGLAATSALSQTVLD
jgi:hypothetical protein